MSCFSLFALAVYFHISYFLYFHIQLFQIYLSGAEMEQRVIWDLAFPQEGRFIYITRLSGPTNLLTEKYLKEYEDVIFFLPLDIFYTLLLCPTSVSHQSARTIIIASMQHIRTTRTLMNIIAELLFRLLEAIFKNAIHK